MKLQGKLWGERGLTLIEMLIALLILILAVVFIIALVSNALNKPKDAGIQNDFGFYEQQGILLLHEVPNDVTEDKLKTEYNSELNNEYEFVNDVSKHVNAYKNPYQLSVEKTVKQTAIVIDTVGKSTSKKYRLVIVKEGGVVESCMEGFGRNDKGLVTLMSELCGEKKVIEDDDGTLDTEGTVAGLEAGDTIILGGREWTLLDPSTGYIHLNVGQELGNRMRFDGSSTKKFNPSGEKNIGYFLNTTWWFNELTNEERGLVIEHDWGIGELTNNDGGFNGREPTLSVAQMRDKEDAEVVTAKVGLLSVSEYYEYSVKYGNGLVESGNERTWLMTPNESYKNSVWYINSTGTLLYNSSDNTQSNQRTRPAMYILNTTSVEQNGTLLP